MPDINRRKFLIASAGVAAAGALAGTAALTLPDLLRAGQQRPLAAGSGILVILTLYGGNDGLNTVIPLTDNAYHDARPDLSYTPEQVLPLDGHLGLNPMLKGLAETWKNKELAIVRGVGYPKPDRSHFRSMDIWQTASPSDPVPTGWIGRWLDATGDDPLRALSIGPVLPPLAIGDKHVAAALFPGAPRVPTEVATILDALGYDDSHDTKAMSEVCSLYRSYATTDRALAPAVMGSDLAVKSGAQNGPTLPDDLKTVAACVKAGVPTRVYMVDLSDFDTHAAERGTQEDLLRILDGALTSFLSDVGTSPHGKDVVVMVYSEFGRRVKANTSQGTDHGSSGPVFLAGTPVKGGFYGDEPSLTDLVDGDLKVTTDFRDVYHEVLSHTLGSDPAPSVGADRRDIGFLA